MHNKININTTPQPIGPYSQIIQTKDFIFISGQIPINHDAELITNDISKQTKIILNNIKNIIENVDLTIKNIVKITIFVTDLNNIHNINLIYKNFFIKHHSRYPARTCVEVSKLPKNSKIEIDAIVVKNLF